MTALVQVYFENISNEFITVLKSAQFHLFTRDRTSCTKLNTLNLWTNERIGFISIWNKVTNNNISTLSHIYIYIILEPQSIFLFRFKCFQLKFADGTTNGGGGEVCVASSPSLHPSSIATALHFINKYIKTRDNFSILSTHPTC